jgi:OmcA/MtrC family decaheme c-type cytochrome
MRRVVSSLAATLVTVVVAVEAAAAIGDCGQPVTGGESASVTDCQFILRAAVGVTICASECVCDTNASGVVSTADALLCLNSVIGGDPLDDCRCIEWPGGSVINESCAVCHGEGRTFGVEAAHPGLHSPVDVLASIDDVSIDIDDATMKATLTVDFTVTGPRGEYIWGLGAPSSSQPDRFAYLRFALSQLTPPEVLSGDPDTWVSYTTGDRNPVNLVDHGDGTYTYVFNTNLYELYVESNRHRLLLIVSGDIVEQAKNVTYDFVPAQLPGPFAFDLSRDIVTTTACNECHGRLGSTLGSASFHSGQRYETKGCATCHTSALGEEGVAELTPMIHEIHTAQNIGGLDDFSDVTFPQDPRNCRKCHAGPDGSNWQTRPSMTACGSCHSDVDFVTGEGHVGGQQFNNANCSFCHSPEDIEVAHRTENATENNPNVPEGLVNFEYVIDEVTVNSNNVAVVSFHINKDGEPLDLTTIPPPGFSGGPGFLLAYALPQDGVAEMVDYNQLGRDSAQPASVSLSSLVGTLTGTPESYTAVLAAAPYPEGATMRAVAMQGYFTQLANPENPESEDVARHTASVIQAVSGDTVRRTVVDEAKCLSCHENLELHGGSRVNNIQVCVVCHNPNLSSSGKAADATLTAPDQKLLLAEAGYDPNDALSWPERSMQLKNLVHAIHGAGKRTFDYEFVRNRSNGLYYNFSEVTFPGILSDCETCHLPGTYGAPPPAGVLVSTELTTDGLNLTRADVLAARATVPNPTDLVNSQTAGSCYLCHDSEPSVAHMQQNGGVIAGWRAEALGD